MRSRRAVIAGLSAVAVGASGATAWARLRPPADAPVPGAMAAAALVQAPPTADQPTAHLPLEPAAATPLRAGATGVRVVALQAALRGLGYQIGTPGAYDDETAHGVIAFQKVHGLPRTGVADAATLAALRAPSPPTARTAAPGFHVEVDLARQVAYFVHDGVVGRVYDVSTGRDAPGKHTPTGEFTVTRKIDGWRHAPLGPMWRPSYLGYDGIAFHGGEPVRAFPDSNGCVRMTDRSVDETYGQLTVGTRVSIY
ncbi:L,D-transpeptidase family protein [Actinokineospora iranica]|uniref:Putative peptidoglycan binding domain-containing protein n=1 Tax=Actinokineospora iranica TaxID=1271860 RepID=A0A1G6U331_9PSEU|nr:L,D-transpeptidase family protein [Actinokineospora iranica]SDD34997.1 Putative peptidoglycan binding domain-containing protein [Actinokineospora iranica]